MKISQREMNEFSLFLYKSRRELGLNLYQIAQMIYVHYTTYSRWERGMHVPQEDMYLIKERINELLKQHRLRSQV